MTWLTGLARRLALALGIRPVRWERVRVRYSRRMGVALFDATGHVRWWATPEDRAVAVARLWRAVCRRVRKKYGRRPRLGGPVGWRTN